MANTTLSQLTSIVGADVAPTDSFLIYDTSANAEKQITLSALRIAVYSEGPNVSSNSFVITSNSSNSAFRITQTGTGNALVVEDSTSPDSSPFVISAAGNVGIGSSSPSGKLEVNTGSLAAYFTRTAEDTGVLDPAFGIATASTTTRLGSSGDLQFMVGAVGTAAISQTERMRITSTGSVGIGLTPSTSNTLTNVSAGALQINGNIELKYGGTNSDPAGARYFNIVNTDTTLVADQPMGGIQWVGLDTDNPNSNMASITSYCSGNAGTTGDLRFKIAGTERMRITSTGSVAVGNTSPDADAILQLDSTTQGFLPPRMTTTQRNDIALPVPAGLMIYNTTTNKLNFYNGTAWEAVTSA